MRLWSLHPRYLDSQGLVALWREGLLAQAVLAGRTRGYRHHPQLIRFLDTPHPRRYIAAYLREVHAEATRRGYRFDAGKLGRSDVHAPLKVSRGQLRYEWLHLQRKLARRAPDWLRRVGARSRLQPHPLFRVIPGGIAEWERSADREAAPTAAARRRVDSRPAGPSARRTSSQAGHPQRQRRPGQPRRAGSDAVSSHQPRSRRPG